LITPIPFKEKFDPFGLTLLTDGRLVFADRTRNNVYLLNPKTHDLIRLAVGSSSSEQGEEETKKRRRPAEFSLPNSVCIDEERSLMYVADYGNRRVCCVPFPIQRTSLLFEQQMTKYVIL